MKNRRFLFLFCLIMGVEANAQVNRNFNKRFVLLNDTIQRKIDVNIDSKLFTTFCYADTIEKPFLFPIYASNGFSITRGFPLNPQPNDPTDHPHHIGLWFNYENVNGLDFWNNSYAIDSEKKKNYGWIHVQKILSTKSGKLASIEYAANWTDQQKKVLLEEITDLNFSTNGSNRIIDRFTKLIAKEDISLNDSKDGLLGLRVAHELELPITETKAYKDGKGNTTYVQATRDSSVTGNYITSDGKQGDAAWGTRGIWCMLYGKLGGDSISIVIIDHPKNPGYPTYWHARNYGLFAANPLGQKIFSNGKTALNFKLHKGQSVIFRYRIVIASGRTPLPHSDIEQLVKRFALLK